MQLLLLRHQALAQQPVDAEGVAGAAGAAGMMTAAERGRELEARLAARRDRLRGVHLGLA